MMRKETYPVELILEHIRSPNKRVVLDGDSVRVKGVRMESFVVHGIVCVRCGLTGAYFVKEKTTDEDTSWHLNLYAINSRGCEVLMTRDHIMPRSKGGSEDISNMQTMCLTCNGLKADKF